MSSQTGNIHQYTSAADSLRPSDIGTNALAQEGRHVGAMGREEGEYYQQAIDHVGGPVAKLVDQHETMTEVSQGAAALAAMHNNLTTQWNQIASKADPNDQKIQGEFLDKTLEPQLEAFQNGFTTERGQEWALSQADAMRTHYSEKTSADMSARAGNAIVLNLKTSLSNLSDAARKDPSSMDASLGQIDAQIQAIKEHNTGTLSPEQIDKMEDIAHDMKNEVVKSGIQGLADINPKAAVDAVNSGKFSNYITGTEGDQLQKYAETVTRMKQEDQSRAYEQQQRAQKQHEEQVSNKILTSVYNPDTGQINIPNNINQQIFSDPSLSSKGKLEIMGAIKHISEESSVDDPAVIRDNAARLGSNSTTPLTHDDLSAQLAQGKLTMTSYRFFDDRLKEDPDTKAEKSAVANALGQVQKSILVPPAPGLPPSQEQRQNQIAFTNWFMPAYTAALKDPSFKDMSVSQKSQILLSSTDPRGLLTPEKLSPFLTSPQQQLADGMKNLGPNGLPSAGALPSQPVTDITKKADATKFNPATKQYIYLVNNKWVDATGKEVK